VAAAEIAHPRDVVTASATAGMRALAAAAISAGLPSLVGETSRQNLTTPMASASIANRNTVPNNSARKLCGKIA
jgi:hypothetical protein